MQGMKRFLVIISLLSAVLIAGGCARTKDFKVTSCSIASLTPNGLKSLKAVLKLGIANPMMNLTISNVNGVINNFGKEFATFEADKLPIERKSEKVYPLPCVGTIARDVGLVDLLKLAASQDFSGMTVDLSLKVKLKCGLGKTLRFKNIKITDLMEPSVAAAYLDLVIKETMI